jgi:hypothetical protein
MSRASPAEFNAFSSAMQGGYSPPYRRKAAGNASNKRLAPRLRRGIGVDFYSRQHGGRVGLYADNSELRLALRAVA